MLSPSPRNPLAYLYSRKQDEVYNQQAGQHPLAQFPSTPDGNHAALYTLPVARGHGQPNRDLVGFSDISNNVCGVKGFFERSAA
jgi:hypothetical protein